MVKLDNSLVFVLDFVNVNMFVLNYNASAFISKGNDNVQVLR